MLLIPGAMADGGGEFTVVSLRESDLVVELDVLSVMMVCATAVPALNIKAPIIVIIFFMLLAPRPCVIFTSTMGNRYALT
jgi:hypothetical protein